MIDLWTTPALSAYVAAAMLIIRGRIDQPTDKDLDGCTMDAWLRHNSGVTLDEIEAAIREMHSLTPEQRDAILERALLPGCLH